MTISCYRTSPRNGLSARACASFSLIAAQHGNEPLDDRRWRARDHVGHRRDLLTARGPFDLELLTLHIGEERGIAHRRIEGAPQDVKPAGRDPGRRHVRVNSSRTFKISIICRSASSRAKSRISGTSASARCLLLPCWTMTRTSFFASQSVWLRLDKALPSVPSTSPRSSAILTSVLDL